MKAKQVELFSKKAEKYRLGQHWFTMEGDRNVCKFCGTLYHISIRDSECFANVAGQSDQITAFSEWLKDNYGIEVPERVVEEYRRYQALHIDHVMPRFVLMGFEFNDLWKVPDLFSHENDGILMTVDEWNKAQVFEAIELAEYKRQYLQANYNGYTWYIVRLN